MCFQKQCFWLSLICCLFVLPVTAGEISSNTATEGNVTRETIFFQGRIDNDDFAKVDQIIQGLKKSGKRFSVDFVVNSAGGSVAAAIQIGRLLRSVGANVWVTPRYQCLSSCIFILAGGDGKFIIEGAKVGIHRPFLTDLPPRSSYDDVRAIYLQTQALARNFIDEMNLHPTLVDDMFSVPPENLRLLSKPELERYGLNQSDPIKQEMRDVSGARELGITREEYLRRLGRLDAVCTIYKGDYKDMGKCVTDVMEGRQ